MSAPLPTPELTSSDAGHSFAASGGSGTVELRADDARIACPLFQAEYGGVTPTSALQLRFCKCSNSLAKTLNERWHSRLPIITNGWDCNASFAAECGNLYYAIAMWGHPRSQSFDQDTIIELRRMAVAPDAPKMTASRMLGWMTRWIKKNLPQIRLLISYQDTEVHKGTIYKAAGWKPVGYTKFAPWKNNTLKIERTQSTADKVRWEYTLRESPND